MADNELSRFYHRYFGRCYIVHPQDQCKSRWPIMRWGDSPWCWKVGRYRDGDLLIYELEASYWYRQIRWSRPVQAIIQHFNGR